jgi:hypothetical protein
MLLRLQDGQSTLEKQTADFNAGVQTRIGQLSAEIVDSQRNTQEMLEPTAQPHRFNPEVAEAYRCVTGTLVGRIPLHCAPASKAPRQICRVEGQSSGAGSRR